MWRALVAGLLFIAFIPGVLVTLPSKSSKKTTILLVHAVLYAVLLHIVMKSCFFAYESFGNHGPASCPPGTRPSLTFGSTEECVGEAHTREEVGSTH